METFHQISTNLAVVLMYLIGLVGLTGLLVMVSVWAFDRILTAKKIREEFLDFVVAKKKKKTFKPKPKERSKGSESS